MKSKSLFAALSALMLSFAATDALSQSAREIASEFETKKAEALEAYLTNNPEAGDLNEALGLLIESRRFLGEEQKIQALLESRYESLTKGSETDLQVLIGEVAAPLIESYRDEGAKEKARAFIGQVKADLASHPMSPQIDQFFEGILGELNAPGVGDEMGIAFTAIDGTEVDLAQMKGKVVLVDFWATWCGPCVGEMPNIIAAHKKYREKGFEVIGISLDEDRAAFDGFLGQRNMTWPQYFDGKGWENDIARKFGIQSIPATFLIGKDGKIAAANLHGSDLEDKVAELLGNPE